MFFLDPARFSDFCYSLLGPLTEIHSPAAEAPCSKTVRGGPSVPGHAPLPPSSEAGEQEVVKIPVDSQAGGGHPQVVAASEKTSGGRLHLTGVCVCLQGFP